MRIGIDATCWSNARGYGRYARSLLTALLAEPTQHEYIFFIDRQTQHDPRWPLPSGIRYVVAETQQSPTEAASANGQRSLRDLWAMTTVVAREPLDVFFYPSLYTYFPIITRASVLLGVHDVIVDEYPRLIFPDPLRLRLWQIKSWLAHQQAHYIVTVSDHARAGILRHFHHPANRVWIVGEAPAVIFQPMTDENALLVVLNRFDLTRSTRFVICLGGLNPHKNLGILISAIAELRKEPQFADLQLVLVGPAENDLFTPGTADLRRLVADLNLESVIRFTGYLPDEDVACLLNAATVFAMPSFDEGFGLGAVEAAACGLPVVATCNSPLPRLLEGAGIFIDPQQPHQLLSAVRNILSDETGRKLMGQIALTRARALTWQKAAQQFNALLTEVEFTRK